MISKRLAGETVIACVLQQNYEAVIRAGQKWNVWRVTINYILVVNIKQNGLP
jgi:hypothetical protein